MTKLARLKLIRVLHRKQLRSQGMSTSLTLSEHKEIGPRLENGEDPRDLALEYGVSPRKIRRVLVNRLVTCGLQTMELSRWQRIRIENL